MKDQEGVTLATVILTVLVIMIIAVTSIVVGNRLIQDAKEQKKDENYRIVVDAVNREIAKKTTGGVISPGVYNYIGIKNPIIGRDDSGNPINAGDDWYLLDSSALEELGVKGLTNNFLVNYKLAAVIDIDNTSDIVAAKLSYEN